MTNPFHPYVPKTRTDTGAVSVDHPSHPGLEQRQHELDRAVLAQTELYGSTPVADILLGPAMEEVGRARVALKRQQNVAADKPAVPGSEKPSVIRKRAQKGRF